MKEQQTEGRRLTLAEAARTLVASSLRGMLSTLRKEDGFPYGSMVDLAPHPEGDVAMLLSSLAEHQNYLEADPRASVLIAPGIAESDALAHPRVSLVGRVEIEENKDALVKPYLERHPEAAPYIGFGDFRFYRLCVEWVRYIAGFGRMGWIEQGAYRTAEPDILGPGAGDVVAHMNGDHAHNLLDYARVLSGMDWAEEARMTGLDCYGFDLVARSGERIEMARIAFDEPLSRPGKIRKALVDLTERALQAMESRNVATVTHAYCYSSSLDTISSDCLGHRMNSWVRCE